MREFSGKWITNSDFYNLAPVNVFHKERDKSDYTPREELLGKHILFRAKFKADKASDTKIYISADDYYKLYVNGEFVTMGPCPGYNFKYYYNEVDISDYLADGENVIAIHSYYQGLINRVWVSGDERHGVIFDVVSNGRLVIKSDESVKCAYHTAFTSLGKITCCDTGLRECYDASAREVGFEKSGFDDSYWENARIKKYVDYKLLPQPTRQPEVYEVKPALIEKREKSIFVDFGQEMAGYLTFTAVGRKNDEIVIRMGEELNPDLTVRSNMRCDCYYEEKLILSGGRDKLNQYDYKAFRYAELIFPEGVKIDEDSIGFIVRHYPYKDRAVNIKDEKLLKIYNLSVNTIKYGVQELYMDCPTREKGQYLCDSALIGLAHIKAGGGTEMFRKFLDNISDSAFICKGLMSVAPCSLMQEIADYSLQISFFVWKYYEMTNDIKTLEEMLPVCEAVYAYFKQYEDEDGLISGVTDKWNLVDWPENLRDGYDFDLSTPVGSGRHNVINAFYIGLLTYIDKLYAELGKDKKTDAERVKASFVRVFYNKEKKLFTDSELSEHCALHSNVLPLLFDISEDEECKQSILKMISEKKLTCCNFFMGAFMLFALQKEREDKLLYDILTDDRAWMNMLSEGATTTFEAWGREQKWNTSLFHPVGAIPILFI